VIGICARCGEEVWPDPLAGDAWRCAAGHEPVLGTPVRDQQALWDGVRRRRKDYVEPVTEGDAPEPELEIVVPPEVAMLPMDPTDEALPASARRMAKLAAEHGWEVGVTYSRGTPLSANGKSVAVRVKEMRLGENGQPEMSPTGKPRFRMVPTGEPLVIDVIVVRMRRGDDRLFASWEDGKLDLCLRAVPLTILNNNTIKELIAS
jgi:hypothetical protein